MLYAILIYGEEEIFERLDADEQERVMEKHRAVQREYGALGSLGPVARLMSTSSAVTVRSRGDSVMVLDGPFAETKEHLLGFYVLECATIDDAIEAAKKFPLATAAYEVRPISWATAMGELTGRV